jgi:hypothetical protein
VGEPRLCFGFAGGVGLFFLVVVLIIVVVADDVRQ